MTPCVQVRRYPGPYECYDIRAPDAPVALEVALTTLGARALPAAPGGPGRAGGDGLGAASCWRRGYIDRVGERLFCVSSDFLKKLSTLGNIS